MGAEGAAAATILVGKLLARDSLRELVVEIGSKDVHFLLVRVRQHSHDGLPAVREPPRGIQDDDPAHQARIVRIHAMAGDP
eukprot:scaffold1616_cov310-Pinguiococcus_pyrenoidosus.AAC.4